MRKFPASVPGNLNPPAAKYGRTKKGNRSHCPPRPQRRNPGARVSPRRGNDQSSTQTRSRPGGSFSFVPANPARNRHSPPAFCSRDTQTSIGWRHPKTAIVSGNSQASPCPGNAGSSFGHYSPDVTQAGFCRPRRSRSFAFGVRSQTGGSGPDSSPRKERNGQSRRSQRANQSASPSHRPIQTPRAIDLQIRFHKRPARCSQTAHGGSNRRGCESHPRSCRAGFRSCRFGPPNLDDARL